MSKLKDPELATLPENFVKQKLDAQDRIPTQARAAIYKEHVHVSSLANDFCARQYAIAIHEKLQLNETFTGGHKVTWRIGRAVEAHVRDSFIAQHGKTNVWAKWICGDCKKYYEGLGSNAKCSCGKGLDIFAEPDIQDDEFGVKGHPDLVFKHSDTYFVMEIKSIKADAWNDLEAPLESHIRQAGMYPYLLGKKLNKVSPVVTFVYVTKDFKFGSPYKEFHIDTSEDRYVKQLAESLNEAKEVKDFVQHGKSPERICASINSALAKKCPVVHRCFHYYQDEVK